MTWGVLSLPSVGAQMGGRCMLVLWTMRFMSVYLALLYVCLMLNQSFAGLRYQKTCRGVHPSRSHRHAFVVIPLAIRNPYPVALLLIEHYHLGRPALLPLTRSHTPRSTRYPPSLSGHEALLLTFLLSPFRRTRWVREHLVKRSMEP